MRQYNFAFYNIDPVTDEVLDYTEKRSGQTAKQVPGKLPASGRATTVTTISKRRTTDMTLYEQYNETPAIGYYAMGNFGGLEILDIEYGIEDKLITCFNWGTGRQMIRRNTIYTTPGGRQYIRKAGDRYYLDEMMRTS